MKLSPKQHGIVDYSSALSNLWLSRVVPSTMMGRRLLAGSAAGVTALSLVTDYELGLARLVPMKAHLTIDAMNGAMFLAAALLLKQENARMKQTLIALGSFALVVTALTNSAEPS
jgi:hypothetical protein